jgi:hypothetical protein
MVVEEEDDDGGLIGKSQSKPLSPIPTARGIDGQVMRVVHYHFSV